MSAVIEQLKKVSTGAGMVTDTNLTVQKFLDEKDYETKTDFADPDGITFFEETMLFLADDKDQKRLLGLKKGMTSTDFMEYGNKRKKVNEISRDRKSREEAVQVAGGAGNRENRKDPENHGRDRVALIWDGV